MLVQQRKAIKQFEVPGASQSLSKKVYRGFLAVALISVMGQNILAKPVIKAIEPVVQVSFSQRLEDQVELDLKNRIKAGLLSVERDDIADDENADAPAIPNNRMTQLTINTNAEVTATKCQTLSEFTINEGIVLEGNKETDVVKILENLKTKVSERLYGAIVKELADQRTHLRALQSKLGDNLAARKKYAKNTIAQIPHVGFREFNLCFADIHEIMATGDQNDLRFTVLVPASTIIAPVGSAIKLSEFGFSHQQLAKEKAIEDSKTLTVPAVGSGN
jgi:hypothetical protein